MAFAQINQRGCVFDSKQGDLSNIPKEIYNSGRVNDVLHWKDDDTDDIFYTLVASVTSGVWQVFPLGNDPEGGDQQPAIPLSLDWDTPSLSCLLQDRTNKFHIFAGGQSLWETDTTTQTPLTNWVPIPIVDASGIDLNPGFINKMATTINSIVLACDNGVYWSQLKASPSDQYVFMRAQDAVTSGGSMSYSGLAQSDSKAGVVAGAWGKDGDTVRRGIFVGQWQNGNLVFSVPQINSLGNFVVPNQMYRVSVASSPLGREILYAVAGNASGGIYCVLRSLDGGITWQEVDPTIGTITGVPLYGPAETRIAGIGQDYNNCISVTQDPQDRDKITVAVGWRLGYFTKTELKGDLDPTTANPADFSSGWTTILAKTQFLHPNFHSIVFDPTDETQQTLYICSDGGLAVTPNLGYTHTFDYNRLLSNLLVRRISTSGGSRGIHERSFLGNVQRGGALGLIAGSLEGNGNAFCNIYPSPQPWRTFRTANGRGVCFLQDGALLDLDDAENLPAKAAGIQERRLDPTIETFKPAEWTQGVGLIPFAGLLNSGLNFDLGSIVKPQNAFFNAEQIPLSTVETPSWENRQAEPQLLHAIAGVGEYVYGLMRAPSDSDSLFMWEKLGKIFERPNLPESTTAVASADGNKVYVGTDLGRIVVMTPPDPAGNPSMTKWTNHDVDFSTLSEPLSTPILGFAIHSDGNNFAFAVSGRLFKETGSLEWQELPSPSRTSPLTNGMVEEYTAITTDWSPPNQPSSVVVVSTLTRVFASFDQGQTWTDITTGLPKTPYITDLSLITESGGLKWLYVATYGWSIWRLLLNPDVINPKKKFRIISLGGGTSAMGITIVRPWPQPNQGSGNMLMPLQQAEVNQANPVQELEWGIDTIAGSDNVKVLLVARFQYSSSDDSVEVFWEVFQNNYYSGGQATNNDSIVLLPGQSKYTTLLLDDEKYVTTGVDFMLQNS